VDYRALNEISSISSAPIGNIEDNMARLFRSTIFSGIDSTRTRTRPRWPLLRCGEATSL
jgi:hypothetical protein